MILSDLSIRRPVFTTMVMIAISAFGALLYSRLPVDLFPDVDFPVVTVTTIYPGADPETVESDVSDPIEEALNSLGGIESLRSVSLDSVSQVIVQFSLDVPLEVAVQDVRDRVAQIQRDLPVAAEPPTVTKLDLGATPVVQLAVAGDVPIETLARWVEDVARPRMERIDGVGTVEAVGGREPEVHVALHLDRLRALDLSVLEVNQTLAAQNLDIPGGRLGDARVERTVTTGARAADVDALADLVLRRVNDVPLRLRDVADVTAGLEEARSYASLDGEPAIALVVQKQSGGNTVAVAAGVLEAVDELRARAPEGVRIEVVQNNATSINASLEAVEFDLLLGAFLAVAIILLFLRDLRATLISALTLPVTVLGTYAFVSVMGFTLNTMTTLALSLSIGILIDDAIVVIENIVRRRSELGESPFVAAQRGASEIGLAVFATTLSIVAVFVPVAFMDGIIGQFFYQFGLTVAFAVMLSLFVAFTLTPMLSARWLAEHNPHPRGISGLIERGLRAVDAAYRVLIDRALRYAPVTMAIAVATLALTFSLADRIGFTFMPVDDRSQFTIRIETPDGTSLESTRQVAESLAAEVADLPGVASTFTTVGGGVQERVDLARILVNLTPRETRGYHQTEIMARIRERLADRDGATWSVEPVQAIEGGGRTEPLQVVLQGGDMEALGRAAERIAARWREIPGIVDVDTSFRSGKPELRLEVDRARAADLGVVAAHVGQTVRTLLAGDVPTTLDLDGERIDVRVQLAPEQREDERVIASAQVRNAAGRLVDVGRVGDLVASIGPTQIERLARQRQVTLYANLDGLALGTASTLANAIVLEELGPGMSWTAEGNAKELERTGASMALALFLAVLCVYLILASQFESFIQPVTIMVSLPFSLIGALGALITMDADMSIFGMIGVIMLMGLVTKNAILLVDYANQLRDAGTPVHEALVEAGAVRLRPILMTTAAMIGGMLPVAMGHGEGGESRAPMGMIVIGGLVSSTLLTLVVVPVVYRWVEALASLLPGRDKPAVADGGIRDFGAGLATAEHEVRG